ncbi:hypothetical protein TKK_0005075 [Trichogramma kaykai]
MIKMPLLHKHLESILQDHNYGAPLPRTISSTESSYTTHETNKDLSDSSDRANIKNSTEDDASSIISIELGYEVEPEGEETETAPEGEGEEGGDGNTRCICDFEHDDGYMICCDRCCVWQHVDCMGIDKSNIPDEYLCEVCCPRKVDRSRARSLQMRKREDLFTTDLSSDGSTDNSHVENKASDSSKKIELFSLERKNSDEECHLKPYQNRHKHFKKFKREKSVNLESKKLNVISNIKSDEEEISNPSIDTYKKATINQYSIELKMKISGFKTDNSQSEIDYENLSDSNVILSTSTFEGKTFNCLKANQDLEQGTPIIELCGKYILKSELDNLHPRGYNQPSPDTLPFMFFYHFQKDDVEVCVDMQTYGNEARFIRRSCIPNAQIKHKIRKKLLHLYIVAISPIQKNTEITIGHDGYEAYSEIFNTTSRQISCACNNFEKCSLRQTDDTFYKKLDNNQENLCKKEWKNNFSRQIQKQMRQTIRSDKIKEKSSHRNAHMFTKKSKIIGNEINRNRKLTTNSQLKISLNTPEMTIDTKHKKKMTREERKLEAIMKAFERLEKAEQRKQDALTRQICRKKPIEFHSQGKNSDCKNVAGLPNLVSHRSKKKSRKNFSTNFISNENLNSTESDLTSGDEHSNINEQNIMKPIAEIFSDDNLKNDNHNALTDSIIKVENERYLKSSKKRLFRDKFKHENFEENINQLNSSPTSVSSTYSLADSAVKPLSSENKIVDNKKKCINDWLLESSIRDKKNEVVEVLSPNYHETQNLASLAELTETIEPSVKVFDSSQNLQSSNQTIDPLSVSAKKRWLRQAISESPQQSIESNSSPLMVAPPKKRRTARENLSTENYSLPKTAPITDHNDDHVEQFKKGDCKENQEKIKKEKCTTELEFNRCNSIDQSIFFDVNKNDDVKPQCHEGGELSTINNIQKCDNNLNKTNIKSETQVVKKEGAKNDIIHTLRLNHFSTDTESSEKSILPTDHVQHDSKTYEKQELNNKLISLEGCEIKKEKSELQLSQELQVEDEKKINFDYSENSNVFDDLEESATINSTFNCETIVPKDENQTLPIPPLSERIRKKFKRKSTEASADNIRQDLIQCSNTNDKIDCKNMKDISSALRELLEIQVESSETVSSHQSHRECYEKCNDIKEVITANIETPKPLISPQRLEFENQEVRPVIKKTPKDPRTAVPKNLVAPNVLSKNESLKVAEKRKLSISEYRQRKQTVKVLLPESNVSSSKKPLLNDAIDTFCPNSVRSFDEDNASDSLLKNEDKTIEKKSIDDDTIGWSAAPTLVERQRENPTRRLRREFGLFSSKTNGEPLQNIDFPDVDAYHQEDIWNSNCIQINNMDSTNHLDEQTSKFSNLISCNEKESILDQTLLLKHQGTPSSENGYNIVKTNQTNRLPQAPPGSNPYPPTVTNETDILSNVSSMKSDKEQFRILKSSIMHAETSVELLSVPDPNSKNSQVSR